MLTAERSGVWSHRVAWLLCGLTFPLIWVGGLITTTDAGMAVPDWPGTYGYNLLLYPWQTWFFGPWDLFIEHGHRLLASLVGLITIALCVIVFRDGQPSKVRRLAVLALVLVCFQGFLGGARVWMNERNLALLHGSTGPLFFAVTVLLVAATANRSQDGKKPIGKLAIALPFLVFVQLVLGATLRHTPEASDPWAFALHVKSHLTMAGVVATAVLALIVRDATAGRRRFPAALALVLLAQVSLGFATWVAKYRYPTWTKPTAALTAEASGQQIGPPRVRRWAETVAPATIQPLTANGFAETVTVTAHSAIGSLLLALAVARSVRWGRAGCSQTKNPASDGEPNDETPLATQTTHAAQRKEQSVLV